LYTVGSTSSGSVKCAVYDATGDKVAERTTTSNQPSANAMHKVAFDNPVVLVPGHYYGQLVFSSGTATYLGNNSYGDVQAAGAHDTIGTLDLNTLADGLRPAISTY
jgi:hypothetical protein